MIMLIVIRVSVHIFSFSDNLLPSIRERSIRKELLAEENFINEDFSSETWAFEYASVKLQYVKSGAIDFLLRQRYTSTKCEEN